MADRRLRERPCPHCGQPMPANAPKCMSCEQVVEVDATDEMSPIQPRMIFILGGIVVVGVAIVGAVAFLTK